MVEEGIILHISNGNIRRCQLSYKSLVIQVYLCFPSSKNLVSPKKLRNYAYENNDHCDSIDYPSGIHEMRWQGNRNSKEEYCGGQKDCNLLKYFHCCGKLFANKFGNKESRESQ